MKIKLHSSLQIRIWKGDNGNNGTSHWFVAVDWLIFFIYLKKKWEPEETNIQRGRILTGRLVSEIFWLVSTHK